MERITHRLVQGSEEWKLWRCKYFGASEAAAMLGISKKTTRTELLNARAGFSEKQFSDFVQRMILDKGHEVEDPARLLAEEFIGDELYPVTMSIGDLSASCDGLTLDGSTAWENKNYNEEYFNLVKNKELPEEHRPQCQQVLLVTGATKLYFTISDGTREKTAGIWIYPDELWFARIEDGWAQFKRDLDKHQYIEYKYAVAEPVAQPPALFANLSEQITGSIIKTNLPEFIKDAETYLAGINVDLKDDNDFATAKEQAKLCREAAKKITAIRELILSQISEIDTLNKAIETWNKAFNAKGLMLEKLVTSREAQIKADAINAARELWLEHIRSLSEEMTPIYLTMTPPDFASAIKSKRTLASIHDAINTELANCKIKADAIAKELRSKLAWYKSEASDFSFLFIDLQSLIYKADDDFKLVITSRIANHIKDQQEKFAAERARIQAQEESKAQCHSEQARILNNPAVVSVTTTTSSQAPITIVSQSDVDAEEVSLNLMPSADDVIRLVADSFFCGNASRASIFLCNTDFSLPF